MEEGGELWVMDGIVWDEDLLLVRGAMEENGKPLTMDMWCKDCLECGVTEGSCRAGSDGCTCREDGIVCSKTDDCLTVGTDEDGH